jgi:tRNA pseudouridine55 synthase
MDGILNILKPCGISSFKALAIVRKRLNIKKVGHLGTLDPLACGVLVLLCGKYTKRANELSTGHKVYRSVFTFGIETTTLDNEGEVIATSQNIPTREQIEKILPTLIGDIEIEVPKFSAVHIDGKRAYDLARQGVEFTAPKRIVNIQRFELIQLDKAEAQIAERSATLAPNEFYFEIQCQTGTYVRSLAKLLAQKLDTVAIASTIIRTAVGQFKIADAKSPNDVTVDDLVTLSL